MRISFNKSQPHHQQLDVIVVMTCTKTLNEFNENPSKRRRRRRRLCCLMKKKIVMRARLSH